MRTWLFCCLLLLCTGVNAEECRPWPQWDHFRDNFVSSEGRVIDPSTPGGQTTSEGQSYALFFSLVANEPNDFERILRWTETNLAAKDMSKRLPAWQWGKKEDGSWGVLDENSAADSDLWIAYSLLEAGRLWKNEKYSALGASLAGRIMSEETGELPQIGRTLLPGAKGFHPEAGVWRLNPSYVPVQILRKMTALYPDSQWNRLLSSSIDMLVRSAPRGFAPDWVLYKTDSGFQPDREPVGSWNAIRVYLWAGMLSAKDPVREILLETFAPMGQYVAKMGVVPLNSGTRDGKVQGDGPAGFSAAMLPFLESSALHDAVKVQQKRVDDAKIFERTDNYYAQVLALFGAGWMENRFRFDFDGTLTANWKCS